MGYGMRKAFPNTVKVDGGIGYRATAADGSGTEVTGPSIDRMPDGGSEGYDSAVIVHAGRADLDENETVSLRTRIQESSDDSNWDTAEEIEAAQVVATGGGGGTSENYHRKLALDLAGRKRYVRLLVTPIGSRNGTDLLHGAVCAVLGGAHELPAG